MNKTYWSVSELAKTAGVSTQYIRWLIANEKLQAEKVGFQWVITDRVARQYLKDREQQQPS